MSAYLAWKLLHILAATVLFGTGLGIAFFAWFGYQRALAVGRIDGLRTVLRLTVIADACFTAPAVLIQFVSGVVLMRLADWPLLGPWGMTAIGSFVLVGLLWLPVVILQVLMSLEADRAPDIPALSPTFHRRFKYWFVLGVPAFLIVVGITYLMVVKPLPVS